MTEHKQWYFRYRMTGEHFAEPLAMRLAVNVFLFFQCICHHQLCQIRIKCGLNLLVVLSKSLEPHAFFSIVFIHVIY